MIVKKILYMHFNFRFHTDCLVEAVLPHFGKERKRKVEELQRELAKASKNNIQR